MSCFYDTSYPWEFSDLYIAATKQSLVKINFSRQKTGLFLVSLFIKGKHKFKGDHLYNTFLDILYNHFTGKKANSNIPVDQPGGTIYQRQAWNVLKQNPCGKSCTYKQIAAQLRNPQAVCLVGTEIDVTLAPVIFHSWRIFGSSKNYNSYCRNFNLDRRLQLERTVL